VYLLTNPAMLIYDAGCLSPKHVPYLRHSTEALPYNMHRAAGTKLSPLLVLEIPQGGGEGLRNKNITHPPSGTSLKKGRFIVCQV